MGTGAAQIGAETTDEENRGTIQLRARRGNGSRRHLPPRPTSRKRVQAVPCPLDRNLRDGRPIVFFPLVPFVALF